MLEPVSVYSCALPGCGVSQQELQQILLISANFPFGALFKNICTYFKSLNLVCGKWLLKQLLNYFVPGFAEGVLQIFGTKLRVFEPLTTSSIHQERRKIKGC